MRQSTLVCILLLGGLLFFAPAVAAQSGDITALASVRSAESLQLPENGGSKTGKPATAPEQPRSAGVAQDDALYTDYEQQTAALPAAQFRPPDLCSLLPAPGSPAYILFGLLGLPVLGLVLSALLTMPARHACRRGQKESR